jgi:RimJ/RimL family protein N-acetyltransferase
MSAPVLETDRLVLRAHLRDDFDDSAAMWADPQVVTYVGGKPSTREESWSRFLRYGGLWPMLGFGYWCVRERATGRFVGEVGFADFHREMSPSLASAPEAGWVLAAHAHGKGYASEAIGGALSWLDRSPHRGRSVCIIAPENAASIRVALKAAYREWARGTYKDNAIVCFERNAAP